MMATETPTESSAANRGISISTWVAMAIFLVYLVFTFAFPVIPIIIFAGSLVGPLINTAAPVGAIIWIVAMVAKRKEKRPIWRAFRYGVIAFGGMGLIVMALGMSTPGYVRKTKQFQRQMQREADVPAIRAWAETTLFSSDEVPASPTICRSMIYDGPKPACMDSITGHFRIHYDPVDRIVELVFGGGFGHWGLCVAPLGTAPQGNHTLPLEDGAWIWHEIQ
jgi:hypothetical protein